MEKDLNQRNTFCKAPGWVHGFALGGFGVVTAILLVVFFFYRETDIWFLWWGNDLPADHVFGEAIHPGIFRTFANTWSNLAFVFVGLYICAFAWWDARRKTTEHDPYAVRQPALMGLLGVGCIVIGIGSGSMHASLMSWGHKFDVYAMFLTFVSLIVLQWARWFPGVSLAGRRWSTWPAFAIAAIVVSILLLVFRQQLGGDVLILAISFLLIILALGIDALFLKRTSQQLRWLVLANVSLLLGLCIAWLDMAGKFTAPDAWLQGHAIWHLLTAATLAYIAYLYRTEVPRRPLED